MYDCSGPRSGSKEVCCTLHTTLHLILNLILNLTGTNLHVQSSSTTIYCTTIYIPKSLKLHIPALPIAYFPHPPSPSSPPPPHLNVIALHCWQYSKKLTGKLGCSTQWTAGPFFLTRDVSITRGLVGWNCGCNQYSMLALLLLT